MTCCNIFKIDLVWPEQVDSHREFSNPKWQPWIYIYIYTFLSMNRFNKFGLHYLSSPHGIEKVFLTPEKILNVHITTFKFAVDWKDWVSEFLQPRLPTVFAGKHRKRLKGSIEWWKPEKSIHLPPMSGCYICMVSTAGLRDFHGHCGHHLCCISDSSFLWQYPRTLLLKIDSLLIFFFCMVPSFCCLNGLAVFFAWLLKKSWKNCLDKWFANTLFVKNADQH